MASSRPSVVSVFDLGGHLKDVPLWLLAEHCTLALLLIVFLVQGLKYVVRKRNAKPSFVSHSEVFFKAIQQIKDLAGQSSVLEWPSIYGAPAASMDVASLKEGELVTYRDNRGAIYKFKLAEGVYVNMYYTKAGYRRSGDLHDCNQFDVVLQGRTRLRMIDPHSGREVVREYGPNDFIVIPARTPHMFEFLEDNCLLEWWDDQFKAWYYKPYRSVIEANLPLAETQAKNFTTQLPAIAAAGGRSKQA